MQKRSELWVYLGIVLVVGIVGFVLATTPVWVGSNVNYTTTEDSSYYHNLSKNISGFDGNLEFAIDTETDIVWKNASGSYNVTAALISEWIKIYNISVGNLTINATYDNQSGFFEVPIQATNTTDSEAAVTIFEFQVNATNDAPNFTGINTSYTFSSAVALSEFLNASDEESHYPLTFNVSFNGTCSHAAWSGRNANENCSLYEFGFGVHNLSNTSAVINMSADQNDVGVYWANFTVWDSGEDYSCPHVWCENSSYEQNQTYYYTSMIQFEIQSSLTINVTDCQNKVFNESFTDTCNVTINTKETDDELNISTYSILRNYAAGQSDVVNTSWFHVNETATATNFRYVVEINVTPTKTEIGNWTINFTVVDDNGDSATEQIYVDVNRTANDLPDLVALSNVTTSVDLETTINLSVYDDDLLIPDKDDFNETTTFSVEVFNLSTMTPEVLNGFDVEVLSMPVSGTNRTSARIVFTPNATEPGEYYINISVNDTDNALDFEHFNITILSNTFPQWILPMNTTFFMYEDSTLSLNFTQNVSDTELDSLTFSYTFTDGNIFDSFVSGFTNSTGILSLTPSDVDVGEHMVNLTVSDGYLENTTTLNFTIVNVEDSPTILYIELDSNATSNETDSSKVYNMSDVNVTEDNSTTFRLWIEDDDLRIPASQKGFYNESFGVGLTIFGVNTSLFNFSVNDGWWPQPDSAPSEALKNRTRYDATFTPLKDDVGDYYALINVSDLGEAFYFLNFSFSVIETEHAPVLSTTVNQSSAVNRTLYYDLNVSDAEDGNDTFSYNLNLNFSYTNLTGDNIFASFFNRSTGVFNITLNDSHAGTYRLNVSVNDSGGLIDYEDFWILVYSPPTLFAPAQNTVFNLTENVTTFLNFTFNHSILDNLTYDFYLDSIFYNGTYNYGPLVLNTSTDSYGNGTNISWRFTPNLTDETYGFYKNLSVVVYPASANLTNASFVNITAAFKLNITHANSPISFDDNIDDQGPTSYDNDVTITLWDHFSDDDYTDSFYSQNATFTLTGNNSGITSSISGAGVLTLSSSSATIGEFYVFGDDTFSNATSNNFTVTFTTPASTSNQQSSSGGSSTKKVPVSLKIIMPDPVSVYKNDYIELPITLQNDGSQTLYDISLSGTVALNGTLSDEVSIAFSKDTFGVLTAGQEENLTMGISVNTEQEGTFEITVDADVANPDYHDWGKMYITIREGEDIREKILFTEEFIVENPECLELTELVNEAKTLMAQGKNSEAITKADEAISACKELIAQAPRAREAFAGIDRTYFYVIVATIAVFVVGIAFYSYKRVILRRRRGSFLQQDIKNRKYLGV